MNLQTFLPSPTLRPFIKSYLIIESQEELINRVLPDTSLVMAIRFKGQVNYLDQHTKSTLPSAVVSGLRKTSRSINYTENTGNILVIFREAGAQAFFQEPLYELFNHSLQLDELAGYRNLSSLEESLDRAATHLERIALTENFLLSKIQVNKQDELVLAALTKIRTEKGIVRIKDLASNFHISLDPFEKRFRKAVGVSPKQFSYLIRMKAIVDGGLQQQSFTEIALKAGYFDQSHFNKDFKSFTGQSPSEFLKVPAFW